MGCAAEYAYQDSDGKAVCFQFVGVMDLMCLEPEANADEVWSEIRERVMPMERRQSILPRERELLMRLSRARKKR